MLSVRIQDELEGMQAGIEEFVNKEKHQVYARVNKHINDSKEPFLREILTALRSGVPLEKKYSAEDILNILSDLSDDCLPASFR